MENCSGKVLSHQEHASAVARNWQRLKDNLGVYTQRFVTVERLFGTIKRSGAAITLY